MTYATQKLTQELRKLTSTSEQFQAKKRRGKLSAIPEDKIGFSKEVEGYLKQKRDYAKRTRSVSVGRY